MIENSTTSTQSIYLDGVRNGRGGKDFTYNPNDGNREIKLPFGAHQNTLKFGPGITADMVSFKINPPSLICKTLITINDGDSSYQLTILEDRNSRFAGARSLESIEVDGVILQMTDIRETLYEGQQPVFTNNAPPPNEVTNLATETDNGGDSAPTFNKQDQQEQAVSSNNAPIPTDIAIGTDINGREIPTFNRGDGHRHFNILESGHNTLTFGEGIARNNLTYAKGDGFTNYIYIDGGENGDRITVLNGGGRAISHSLDRITVDGYTIALSDITEVENAVIKQEDIKQDVISPLEVTPATLDAMASFSPKIELQPISFFDNTAIAVGALGTLLTTAS
ncbi:hypothetical protein [Yersinia frederiksenii]|uniref:hypothetical protein n=1 Tax=Yersinia frederiksenii TaxID=29484 RepID=UPI0005E49469|nr:hypothetical protein [Yersinia frederiksenii]CNF87502.1 Uncharacterised protein [Yersinia frederiksenii]